MQSLGNELPKLEGAVLDEMVCQICQHIMHPPIIICLVGHSFCNECDKKLLYCPYCRGIKLSTRNYALEKIHNKINLPCKYNSEGCTFVDIGERIMKHEEMCLFNESAKFEIQGSNNSDEARNNTVYEEMLRILTQSILDSIGTLQGENDNQTVEQDDNVDTGNSHEQEQEVLAETPLQPEQEEEFVEEEQVIEDNSDWLGAEYLGEMEINEVETVEEPRELTAHEFEILTAQEAGSVIEEEQIGEIMKEEEEIVSEESDEDDPVFVYNTNHLQDLYGFIDLEGNFN